MDDNETLPAQHQDRQPGLEQDMHPQPIYLSSDYRAANKLAGSDGCRLAQAQQRYRDWCNFLRRTGSREPISASTCGQSSRI